VLKGGTLLTHVYSSPRQSIQDADYLHRQAETMSAPELEQALLGDSQGITFEPAFSYQAGREQFRGTVEFTFDDIVIRCSRPLKVSVSVRPGEWLDPPRSPLDYHDPLLAEHNTFKVQGLSLNELAAEKLLGWCSKDLPKHLVDLAYIAREHPAEIDHELVAWLLRSSPTRADEAVTASWASPAWPSSPAASPTAGDWTRSCTAEDSATSSSRSPSSGDPPSRH
jgi:hypothetical protein